ncbi:MAG: hypothetical protein MAG451_02660 [Anaerolineales bacterium]|nr:hypothetical protein [Anaerolineales bacterium]
MRLKQRLEANPHPSIQLSLRYSLLRMLVNELSIIGTIIYLQFPKVVNMPLGTP